MNNSDIIILFLLTVFVTIFFTFFLRKILILAGIVDNPIVTEHRHKTGTPTMGGIGFIFSALLIATIYIKNEILLVVVIIMVTSGIAGILDDLVGLKVKEFQKLVKNISNEPVAIGQLVLSPKNEARVATPKAKKEVDDLIAKNKVEVIDKIPIKNEIEEREKIIIQLIIGIFLVATGTFTSLGGYLLGLLGIPIALIAIMGAINAVNLIDGMDGLAAGIIAIASISSGIFLYLNGNVESIPPFALLSGISLGFLVFNKHPATIFMGDTGSFILGAGYATAVLLTDIPYFGVLSLIVPISSVIISLLHRVKIIRLPVEPLHHTLHYKGVSERKILFGYWILTAIFSAVGIFVNYYLF
jgi:phospho-N-acetylmuramoyl-pentapeptide-transferase